MMPIIDRIRGLGRFGDAAVALAYQVIKFGLVGAVATGIHAATFVLLVGWWSVNALAANTIAFAGAVGFSYLGHRHWTFSGDYDARGSFAKFVVISLIGFAANTANVFVVDYVLSAPYVYCLPGMVFVVPLFVFLLSRYWAFGGANGSLRRLPPERA